jgi:hypothetical protein
MKTEDDVLVQLQALLAEAISFGTGIPFERIRSMTSFFPSLEDFYDVPMRLRVFRGASGKQINLLTNEERDLIEAFRQRVAASRSPISECFEIARRANI